MKEAGLKGQDILTLMRLYVGSADGEFDHNPNKPCPVDTV